MTALLKFANGNAKIGKHIHTFSLPSGHSCPGALECLSKANKDTGKLTDGKFNKFRCFSASQENQYPNVRKSRWHNFELLRQIDFASTVQLIHDSLPVNSKIIRIHVAGDLFSQTYFDAWAMVAACNQDMKFYFYTKSLQYWVNRIDHIGNGHKEEYFCRNFIPTASRGGKYDHLIEKYNLRTAEVVFSVEEANKKKLEIDHDDSHAQKFGKSFALLLHGKQPKGSDASKALSKLEHSGWSGYSKVNKLSLPVV